MRGSISTPAVDGPGVHHDGVGLGAREDARVQAEGARVLPRARDHRARRAARSGCGASSRRRRRRRASSRFSNALHRGAERLGVPRHQRPRPAEAHLGAERPEEQRVRARDARMKDVAADGDHEAREATLLAPDGERVEQRLRGVLVRAVARVDDRRARGRWRRSAARPTPGDAGRWRRRAAPRGCAPCRGASRPW